MRSLRDSAESVQMVPSSAARGCWQIYAHAETSEPEYARSSRELIGTHIGIVPIIVCILDPLSFVSMLLVTLKEATHTWRD